MANKIVALEIRQRHPLHLGSLTDSYYARFANKVLKLLETYPNWDNPEHLRLIAIDVALYMEDIISDCGIWRSFVGKHRELYGKLLPFYDVDEDAYYTDEPNLEDIQFIIWQELYNTVGMILNPKESHLTQMAELVFALCEEAFEELPINEALSDFFRSASFLDDFIEMRFTLEWFLFDCYLTATPQLQPFLDELVETTEEFIIDPDQATYLSRSLAPFTYSVGPLALEPKEWLQSVLQSNGVHDKAKIIEDIDFRSFSCLRVLRETPEGLYFETVGGEEIFASYYAFNLEPGQIKAGYDLLMSVVKFRDEWNLNGVLSGSRESGLFEYWKEKDRERHPVKIGISNYKDLMQSSGGSPLFYFKDIKEYEEFLVHRMQLEGVNEVLKSLPQTKDLVVFMPAENRGFETMDGIARCISDVRNPYYDPNVERDLYWSAFIKQMPREMLTYLFEHDLFKDLSFKVEKGLDPQMGRKLVVDNWDFLARCYKRMNY